MFTEKTRKVIAVLVAAVMCIGTVPAIAFADDSEEKGKEVKLLVFGNSTSSGYGMPDFADHANGFSRRNDDLTNWSKEEAESLGMGRMSEAAYPWKLKNYILGQEDVSKCTLLPITMNGMRTDELRLFLDKDFFQDSIEREWEYAHKWRDAKESRAGINDAELLDNYQGFMRSHIKWYLGNYHKDGMISNEGSVRRDDLGTYVNKRGQETYASDYNEAAYEEASAVIQDEIRTSDYIVVDLCNNNFGTYLGYRFAAYLDMSNFYAAPNTFETMSDVRDLPDSMKRSLERIRERLMESSDMFKDGPALQLLDAYLYSAADCIVNFSAEMDWIIRNKKDDAKVIVVGLNNPMDGLKIKSGDITLDLGQAAGGIYEMVNTYIRLIDKNADNYYYADLSDGTVTFASSIAEADSLDELLADGDFEDGRGYYAVKLMFDHFNEDYLGNLFAGEPEDLYNNVFVSTFGQYGVTLKAWDEMEDGDIVTGDPGIFVTFDTSQADISKAIGYDTEGTLHPAGHIEGDDPVMYMTKGNIAGCVRRIYQMIFDGAHHETIDIAALTENVTDMSKVTGDIIKYVFGSVDELPDDVLALMNILERFMLYNGVGEHPNAVGCEQKYQIVLEAYENDVTARTDAEKKILDELYELIMKYIEEISEKLTPEEREMIIKELEQIFEELKVIGNSVILLPEYERTVDAYRDLIEQLSYTSADLKDEVESLERKAARLSAKAVKVDIRSDVTFPSGKALITIFWEDDEDAEGYELRVDGKQKEFQPAENGYAYELHNAKIGEKYSFEVKPYVMYAGEKVYGRTYKKSVTPKVSLKKAAIKKVKAGKESFTVKWKKVSGATGYQISYKSGKKTVSGAGKTSLKVRKLKSGKKYTVKVRAWKKVNGKKYYGSWSKAKKVKVK